MVALPFSFVLLAVIPCLIWAIPTTDPILARDVSVSTPLGPAQGTLDVDGANRFAVRYANATRWAQSTIVTEWSLPNGSDDPTALPLQCPQINVDTSTYSEDCLSMILYVPVDVAPDSRVPTLVWIHGGSFDSGSATLPGLDGSKLAIATGSIVAVIQYRLGALGLLMPDGSTNFAVRDTINAVEFLGQVLPSFGGDPTMITLAGQSSGASMIRTLLAVPSASSLFRNAILHSDPMDYGFLSTDTQALLQRTFNDLVSCAAADIACQMALTLDEILDAQVTVEDEATDLDPSTGIGSPLRPVTDGQLVTTTLDSTTPFPAVTKPLLLTNVKNEAGPTMYDLLFPGPDPVPAFEFQPVCEASLGVDRTAIVMNSSFYPVDPNGDARVPLQLLGTDYIWRCPVWTLARSWVANGGSAYVGLFTVGATDPANADIPYCLEDGVVCHRDDIQLVFGTVPNPTAAQAAVTAEMQARYRVFIQTGNPNAPGLEPWAAATTSDVHARELGIKTTPSGDDPIRACTPAFWGAAVQYDYQFFDI
ncbi:Alpha/Beta hydrolase protein [Mycena rosella]|uniref:Carboxylic ester hydrolase n=1 Tax=Mycena rosella TaxID=1033263 RepID=A0AAD7D808_MYCRO|nr:Alpha/Beta hydrolase protein [Mycena rosella]